MDEVLGSQVDLIKDFRMLVLIQNHRSVNRRRASKSVAQREQARRSLDRVLMQKSELKGQKDSQNCSSNHYDCTESLKESKKTKKDFKFSDGTCFDATSGAKRA